eukprot:COSAG01_NODE_309_length_19142_cov_22.748149_3_plen_149_part_00
MNTQSQGRHIGKRDSDQMLSTTQFSTKGAAEGQTRLGATYLASHFDQGRALWHCTGGCSWFGRHPHQAWALWRVWSWEIFENCRVRLIKHRFCSRSCRRNALDADKNNSGVKFSKIKKQAIVVTQSWSPARRRPRPRQSSLQHDAARA